MILVPCPVCGHDTIRHGLGCSAGATAPCNCTMSVTDILCSEIVRLRTELQTARQDARRREDELQRQLAAGRRAYLSAAQDISDLTARLNEALS